jgi:hypothetical protein
MRKGRTVGHKRARKKMGNDNMKNKKDRSRKETSNRTAV